MKRTVIWLSLLLATNAGAAEFGDEKFMRLLSKTKMSTLKDLDRLTLLCNLVETRCNRKATLVVFDELGYQTPIELAMTTIRLNRALSYKLSRIGSEALLSDKSKRKPKLFDLESEIRGTRWDSNPVKYLHAGYYSKETRANIVELFNYSKDIKLQIFEVTV